MVQCSSEQQGSEGLLELVEGSQRPFSISGEQRADLPSRITGRPSSSVTAAFERGKKEFPLGGALHLGSWNQPVGACTLLSVHPSRFVAPGRCQQQILKQFAERSLSRRSPEGPPQWCDQIPTPAENQPHPYSEHSCAPSHSHDSGRLAADRTLHHRTRSCCCEHHHPPGCSKTQRAAVGCSICPTGAIYQASKQAERDRQT